MNMLRLLSTPLNEIELNQIKIRQEKWLKNIEKMFVKN